MSSQKRTIMGACDYSIATMQQLKKDLANVDAANPELNWAIGGIVVTLTANLLQICNDVFQEACATGNPNAKTDLTEIKRRMDEFVDRMIDHE